MRDEELIQLIERRFEKERDEIIKKGDRMKARDEEEFDLVKIPIKVVERAIEGERKNRRGNSF